jgi:hypothetical protein
MITEERKELYILIHLEKEAIRGKELNPRLMREKIEELSNYGKVSKYRTLQELFQDQGIENKEDPEEIVMLVRYLESGIKKRTGKLESELNHYKNVLKEIKEKFLELKI